MFDHQKSSWFSKFGHAFRGIGVGMVGQSSFLVHLPTAIAVCVLAWCLNIDAVRFCILLLCIAAVLGAELFNSSVEFIARSITNETDPNLRNALDIASGAVLLTSIFAAAVGLTVLLPELVSTF